MKLSPQQQIWKARTADSLAFVEATLEDFVPLGPRTPRHLITYERNGLWGMVVVNAETQLVQEAFQCVRNFRNRTSLAMFTMRPFQYATRGELFFSWYALGIEPRYRHSISRKAIRVAVSRGLKI